MDAYQYSAVDAAAAIAEGAVSAEELMRSCLERVAAVDEQVQAWAYLEPELALERAREADRQRQAGKPLGALHGLPVGLKDIIDTFDMPTEYGTVLHAGQVPGGDAAVVERLQAAGAVIMGKTVTTELAVFAPGKTRNPHNPEHTPGGSSSGSAAAVAAGMVPLAVGTQTNGSVIRPAAFCGVYGFKPSHGLISRHRVLMQSRTLDQVGAFARSLEDLALISETLIGYDARDPDSRRRALPPLRALVASEPPMAPRLALLKTPYWDRVEPAVAAGFAELAEALGDRVEDYPLPAGYERVWEWHQCIMEAEQAYHYRREYERGRDRLSERLRAMIERGQATTAVAYQQARAARELCRDDFGEFFEDYDAILMPAAPGEAPAGLDSTGDPVFCTLASFLGAPALNLPLLQGERGLPVGVQLVGAEGDDARLLRTARWIENRLSD